MLLTPVITKFGMEQKRSVMELELEEEEFFSAQSSLSSRSRGSSSSCQSNDDIPVMPKQFCLIPVIHRQHGYNKVRLACVWGRKHCYSLQESIYEISANFPMTQSMIYDKLMFSIEVTDGSRVRKTAPLPRLWKVSQDFKSFQFGFETSRASVGHSVRIKFRGRHIQGSPYKFRVEDQLDTNSNPRPTKGVLLRKLENHIRNHYRRHGLDPPSNFSRGSPLPQCSGSSTSSSSTSSDVEAVVEVSTTFEKLSLARRIKSLSNVDGTSREGRKEPL